MRQRPLSPHLDVYRFAYTMATSILHRITGVVLSAGLLVLVWWLLAAAGDAEGYAGVAAILGSGPMQVLLAGWVIAFVYHLCNGIRHLSWDLGYGLEKTEARRSARWVVIATVLISLALLYAGFVLRGAP
ncbi:MAG: succinate dehydrogenase, cytochrome b556 subunit [Sinobacteraceae bacterium]|nr:succinate dehydrogenase, cytochrome b556 subunit [Nevskiaceae bacterium]